MATGFQASPPRQKPFGSNCFVTSPAPRRLFGVRTTGASCAPRGRVAPRKSEYRRGSSCDQVVDLCARQSSNAVYTSKWYTSLCSSKRRQLLRYTITGILLSARRYEHACGGEWRSMFFHPETESDVMVSVLRNELLPVSPSKQYRQFENPTVERKKTLCARTAILDGNGNT